MGESMDKYANKFGKPDLERLGLFIEMPYMNGKGYVSPFPKPRVDKGRNIMCQRYYTKNGTQHGYFDSEFKRLFIGEGITRRTKKRISKEEEDKKKKPAFIPAGSSKKHSCPGDYFGTFAGKVEAFSRIAKKKPPYQRPKRGIYTNPGKKGGPGYANICLSKYPEYKPSPYKPKPKYKEYGKIRAGPMYYMHFPQPFFDKNPFFEEKLGRVYVAPKPSRHFIAGAGKWIPTGPAKSQGGCHAGLFSKTPEYISNRSRARELKEKAAKAAQRKKEAEEGRKFVPQAMGVKRMFTTPVMYYNTDLSVNVTNYKTFEPIFVKHLIS